MIKTSRLLVLAALSATLVLAQPPGAPSGTPPDPATMIQMKVARLTTLLSLTTAQQTQATTLFTNAYTAGQTAHTALQTDQQTLSTAVKGNDTAAIDQLTANMGTLQGQLASINAKANAAFYAILTADQKTRYDALPHGGPGFGPPGPAPFAGVPPPQ